MHGDLVYFVIAAPDSQRARTFYGGLFGWDITPGNVEDGWQIGRSSPPGGMQGGADAGPPQVYFEVDDLAEASPPSAFTRSIASAEDSGSAARSPCGQRRRHTGAGRAAALDVRRPARVVQSARPLAGRRPPIPTAWRRLA